MDSSAGNTSGTTGHEPIFEVFDDNVEMTDESNPTPQPTQKFPEQRASGFSSEPKPAQLLTGKPKEAVIKLMRCLDKSKKTANHITNAHSFKKGSQNLNLKLRKLKESLQKPKAFTVMYEVKEVNVHKHL